MCAVAVTAEARQSGLSVARVGMEKVGGRGGDRSGQGLLGGVLQEDQASRRHDKHAVLEDGGLHRSFLVTISTVAGLGPVA